ncbi:MAG: fatty acid amide hydrolase [Maribacter sp.]|jgi:fatty acid amide hydrolase
MEIQKIHSQSLAKTARCIQAGAYSSFQVVQAFIDRIKEVNPKLNAVVYPRFDEALKEAKEADRLLEKGIIKGRLHGVPVTIKECLDLIGTPSSFGLIRRKDDFPNENDPYVQALIDEGVIIIGKTNVSQLLAYIEADNPLYGRTNHPTHSEFSCGGSSGGEGAIISAGGSMLGLGTDLGGSVRLPAAFCGISGLKPTMQRNFDFSRLIENVEWEMICSVTGILGKHVEDIALAGEIMGSIPNPFNVNPQPFPNYKNIDVKKIRVGYYLSDGLFEPTLAIKKGIENTIDQLKSQGIYCKEIQAFLPRKAEFLHTKINSIDGAKFFLENLQKDKAAPQIKALVGLMRLPAFFIQFLGKILILLGQKSAGRMGTHFGLKRKDIDKVNKEHQAYIHAYQQMMAEEKIDIIICPANSMPAYLHGNSKYLGSAGTYTLTHNVTGFPAGVVPVSKVKKEDIIPRKRTLEIANNIARKIELKSEGLPVVVQVAALPWREDLVLAMMDWIEK